MGFILPLIGCNTINIPDIFFGVHAFITLTVRGIKTCTVSTNWTIVQSNLSLKTLHKTMYSSDHVHTCLCRSLTVLTWYLIGALYLMPGYWTWINWDGKTDDEPQTSSTHTWLLVHHPATCTVQQISWSICYLLAHYHDGTCIYIAHFPKFKMCFTIQLRSDVSL